MSWQESFRAWLEEIVARVRSLGNYGGDSGQAPHPSRLRLLDQAQSLGPKATCQRARDGRGVYLLKQWNDLGLEARRDLKRGLAVRSRVKQRSLLPVLTFDELKLAHGGGTIFSVQEDPGPNLRDFLTSQGNKVPLEVGFEVVRQMARALQSAHESGLIHGNLSPDAVFVASRGGDKPDVVVDFVRFTGLESNSNAALTVMDLFPTGRDYLAPETLLGTPTDEGSDLFNLGLVAYEIFTGQRAFQVEGRNTMQRVKAQLEAYIPPVSTLRSDLPDVWATAITRLLKRERKQRFASAKEFVEFVS